MKAGRSITRDGNNDRDPIEAYIDRFPGEIQARLRMLRKIIKAAAPEAEETISYGMPAFVLHGNLVYFAAFKHHIGLYPTPSGVDAFIPELSAYRSGKGSIRFPLDKPLPSDLISRIVRFRVAENTRRADGKKGNKGRNR